MNNPFGLIIALLTLLLSTVPTTIGQPNRTAIALRQEGQRQAERFWFARIVQCGDDYFTKERNYIHQFRNIRITVVPTDVTRADRLNGVQWRGRTSLVVGQSRTYSPTRTLYQDPGWSRWANGFTGSMGGVGLDATLQKENGRWTVTPSSISQSGSLTAVSCDEAANPAAAYKQAQATAFREAVAKFKEDAPRMGIYAHNIPEEMWTALYRCGNPANNQRYSMVSWVFLGANGGWGVCGRNGCLNSFLVSLPDGRWSMEQITKDGGYFLVDLNKDQNGNSRRNFAAKDVSPALIKQVQDYLNKGFTIGEVRIGYSGEWFVLASGVRRCMGCTNTAIWSWANVAVDAGNAFSHLVHKYESDWTGSSGSIVDVGFAANGGWVIIYDKYRYFGVGIPAEALRILNMLSTAKYEINQIAFGPNDSWIIRANGSW